MKNVLITGYTGFVGQNLVKYLEKEVELKLFDFRKNNLYKELDNINIVIHLAGKAHDLKNVSDPNEYYKINTDLTKKIYDAFLQSDAQIFITLSSIKAVVDHASGIICEDEKMNPATHYGKSKQLAEEYILQHPAGSNKKAYILRPCMIHGPGNKGNLNLLYKLVDKGIPWPLGAYNNQRSFCSIDNLCFVINELINRTDIAPGVYHISDDEPLSTNELIRIIASEGKKTARIWRIPTGLIGMLARTGDFLRLGFNSERLHKLTDNYIVSNQKIMNAVKKTLPLTARQGLKKTIRSFKFNDNL